MVAMVRSARRAGSPRSRSSVNACGLVTSWTRWRSTYSTAGVSAVSGATTCASQTFSKSVRGLKCVSSSVVSLRLDGAHLPRGLDLGVAGRELQGDAVHDVEV